MSPPDDDLHAALDAMTPPELEPGLADRVARRLRASEGTGTRRLRPWHVATIVGSVTAAVLAAWLVRPADQRIAVGTWRGGERATLELGDRGRAVVEAGAALAWEAADDRTRVEHRAGAAFYRVDSGRLFEVVTPTGTISVMGTCFSVEVMNMKRPSRAVLAGVATGAVAATLVVVSVYEGRVLLANEHGRAEAAAGDQARIPLAGAPVVVPGREQATDAVAVVAGGTGETSAVPIGELARLRTRVVELERRLGSSTAMIAELRREAGVAPRVAPTQEQLFEWANHCEIHIDTPDVFGTTPARLDDLKIERWGIEPAEVPEMHDALAKVHAEAHAELRRLYIEATGDSAAADHLSPSALYDEIIDKAAPGTLEVARRRMALERAGLAAPPANLHALPPAEQVYRLFARLGDRFERLLGESLGPDRARFLRERWNGWPGMRFDSNGCPPDARK
jgi:hypothetical protein